MNIFVLDYNPQKAALYHCDKHVVKMILESAQILSSICRLKNGVLTKVAVRKANGIELIDWYVLDTDCFDSKPVVIHGDFYNVLVNYEVYAITHKNHPCTIWAGKSKQNYLWLVELSRYLNDEFMFRFNHEVNHKSYDVITELPDIELPDIGLTDFAQAIPDYCKITDCTVMNYREYYRKEKSHILKYTQCSYPYWIN